MTAPLLGTRSTPVVLLTVAGALVGCSAASMSDGPASHTLILQARTRARAGDTGPSATPTTSQLIHHKLLWQARHTAIVICDMWNTHWCEGAARRVAEMAGPMNELVRFARKRGVFVIHAPSSTVDFYNGTPQRRRAKEAPFAEPPTPLSTAKRWGTTWCWPDATRESDMPIDDSDMGCDCRETCTISRPWTRQIDTIEIHEDDAISHDGQEVYNLLAERGIDNVILMGVHLNMCVLGRPFGIRQLVRLGKNVVLVRDMTDTMYNHRKRPFVNHFTGTDLVVAHVEEYWCPSVTSVDFSGGEPFRFKEDRRGAPNGDFMQIFDGRSLAGWRVLPTSESRAWSVRDGLLVGSTDGTGSDLIWKETDLDDFELKLSYRFRTAGNSGIHVRGILGESTSHRVKGYHADFGHVGVGRKVLGAWDFHGAPRGDHLVARGHRVLIDAQGDKLLQDIDGALTPDDVHARGWNDVHVVAIGNSLHFTINGKMASAVVDEEPAKRIDRGIIGLQLHGGPPMTVEFREIRLKRLGAKPSD